MTNREAFLSGQTPCEIDPKTGDLSRLRDLYHADAEYSADLDGWSLRFCAGCWLKWKGGRGGRGVRYPEVEAA